MRAVTHDITAPSTDASSRNTTVYSVVLDLPRNQACSGSMDGTVRVWNLAKGECQHTLSGHTSLVGLLGLSPSYLVSAAVDSTLRIWDPDTGENKHTLAAHTGAITCFQHDEFKVLSGSDGNLKMWNIRDGSVVRDLLTGITGVWQVVFEGRWCVAASNRQDTTVLDVWDFGTENDDDWVGEPPNGIYDDEDFEEDEEEDEGAYKIKRLMELQEEEEEEQADVDAMDQDLVPSETDSLVDMTDSENRKTRLGEVSRSTSGEELEPDEENREADTDAMSAVEGADPARWANGNGANGNAGTSSNGSNNTRAAAGGVRTREGRPSRLVSAGPQMTGAQRRAAHAASLQTFNAAGASSTAAPLPTMEDTPTRPRIRGPIRRHR